MSLLCSLLPPLGPWGGPCPSLASLALAPLLRLRVAAAAAWRARRLRARGWVRSGRDACGWCGAWLWAPRRWSVRAVPRVACPGCGWVGRPAWVSFRGGVAWLVRA